MHFYKYINKSTHPIIFICLLIVFTSNCAEQKDTLLIDDFPPTVTVIADPAPPGLRPAAGGDSVSAAGLIAYESIEFKSEALIRGNAAVIGIKGNKDSKFELIVGEKVTIAANVRLKAQTIRVKEKAVISGALEADTFDIHKKVTVANKFSPLATVPIPPKFITGQPGTAHVKIESDQALVAGEYGKIEIRKNKKLTLAGGYYHIAELKMHERSNLHCAKSCAVMVQGGFKLEERVNIIAEKGSADYFTFYLETRKSGGDHHHHHHDNDVEEIEFKDKSNILANIYAPYAKIVAECRAQIQGIIIARKLKLGHGVTYTSTATAKDLTGKFITASSIDIQGVQLVNANNEIIPVVPTINPVDLFTLQNINNLRAFLGPTLLPAGDYKEILLILGEQNFVTVDGYQVPVSLIDGAAANIVTLAGNFTLRGGRITELKLASATGNSLFLAMGQIVYVNPRVGITSVKSFTPVQEQKVVALIPGPESEEFIAYSDAIVLSKTNQTSVDFGMDIYGERQIYTYASLSIQDVLKGELAQDTVLNVRVLGGTIGNEGLYVTHAVKYLTDETATYFFKQVAGRYTVVGGDRGKIP